MDQPRLDPVEVRHQPHVIGVIPPHVFQAIAEGLAAREVAVSALGTVYALSGSGDDPTDALIPILQHDWGLPTALSLMMWYVFAPMCLSTLAAIKRETGGWRMTIVAASYLMGLAYVASFATYHLALALGWH